ncbi:hypothetical protein [Bacillus wiedmannii]|uniref:Uncharacterized protein n=1 Tax=Bacillus wiedmannii TaxID=1890302 RepID=A0A2A8BSU4_9BACI|nr:hypothetical protein [Bacillus wiedmannii]PEM57624.1 hypothetical protein CN611_07370 [Bacillus wiedmannii]
MNLERMMNTLGEFVETGRMSAHTKDELREIYGELKPAYEKQLQRDKSKEMGIQTHYNTSVEHIEKDATVCMNVFNSFAAKFGEVEDELKVLQAMQEDILHALEFLSDEEIDKPKLMDDLTVIRRQRRVAKDYLELSKPLHGIVTRYEGLKGDMKNAVNEIKKVKQYQSNRMYTPRKLTGLEEAFRKAEDKRDEK